MKFIREIISRGQDDTAAGGTVPAEGRRAPREALDLEAFSVSPGPAGAEEAAMPDPATPEHAAPGHAAPGHAVSGRAAGIAGEDALKDAMKDLAGAPAEDPAEDPAKEVVNEDDLCRMVADSDWMPMRPPAPVAGTEAMPAGAAGEAAPEAVPEAGDEDPAPEDDDEIAGRMLGARAAARAMAARRAQPSPPHAAGAAGAGPDPAAAAPGADMPGADMPGSDVPGAGLPGSGVQDADMADAPLPNGRGGAEQVAVLRPLTPGRADAAPGGIGALRDPFERLGAEAAGTAGAAPRAGSERPSPFQRPGGGADAAGAAAGAATGVDAGTASPRGERPRTRLAGDLERQLAAGGVEVPPPAAGRAARRAGRAVKTRLLGFGGAFDEPDPLRAAGAAATAGPKYPVGWLVVVSGPGRGHAFTLSAGVSQIGRGEDQAVRLDFGDTSISRSNHAAIAYDPRDRRFYLGHGGKANLVRLNGRPVLSTEELPDGSTISIGETTLRFVALCGAGFDWDGTNDDDAERAVLG